MNNFYFFFAKVYITISLRANINLVYQEWTYVRKYVSYMLFCDESKMHFLRKSGEMTGRQEIQKCSRLIRSGEISGEFGGFNEELKFKIL